MKRYASGFKKLKKIGQGKMIHIVQSINSLGGFLVLTCIIELSLGLIIILCNHML